MSEARPEADALDAAVRAFALADRFEADSAELRSRLRRLRVAGRVAPTWSSESQPRAPLPHAVSRIAVEAALLIAAAVFAGVAGFGTAAVVVTMAAAWLVVCGVEWIALRERRESDLLAEESYAQSLLEALRPTETARSRVRS